MTGKQPGDVEDGLDHGFPDLGLEVIELGGVVPGSARPVVSVIDVANVAGPFVLSLKDDGRVRPVVVAVLDPDGDAIV